MTPKGSGYPMAAGVGCAAVIMLIWLSLGVGILGPDGDRANLMYAGVVAVGLIGSIVVRLQARGMAGVLCAMAVAQTVVTVIALLVGVQHSGVSPVAEIVLLNAFFVAMFLASAWLFRNAATTGSGGITEAAT